MTETPGGWYITVEPTERITQGDLIGECPLLTWNPKPEVSPAGFESAEQLKSRVEAVLSDVVVMTQACDLEFEKVHNVVLCPHISRSEYRSAWEAKCRAQGQNPSEKAWARRLDAIREGLIWNLTILNAHCQGPVATEHRIVDFHEVFTVPRTFLETLVVQRGQRRLRLASPYREHLSQAFARFFMRVGLPVPIDEGV